jgi:hypothetical protein
MAATGRPTKLDDLIMVRQQAAKALDEAEPRKAGKRSMAAPTRGLVPSRLVGVASAIAAASVLTHCGGTVAATTEAGVGRGEDGRLYAGCAGPLGGQPCDPGYVDCDSTRCSTNAGSFCCADQPGLGCLAPGAMVVPSLTCEAPVYCNEAADCPIGTVCCGDVVCPGAVPDCNAFAEQRCLADCDGGFGRYGVPWQACRSNAECPSGTCLAQFCQSGAGNGVAVEACEMLRGCNPL